MKDRRELRVVGSDTVNISSPPRRGVVHATLKTRTHNSVEKRCPELTLHKSKQKFLGCVPLSVP